MSVIGRISSILPLPFHFDVVFFCLSCYWCATMPITYTIRLDFHPLDITLVALLVLLLVVLISLVVVLLLPLMPPSVFATFCMPTLLYSLGAEIGPLCETDIGAALNRITFFSQLIRLYYTIYQYVRTYRFDNNKFYEISCPYIILFAYI